METNENILHRKVLGEQAGDRSINSEQMAQELQTGTAQNWLGLLWNKEAFLDRDTPLLTHEEIIGRVTSGTQSPSLEQGIGLGYIDSD